MATLLEGARQARAGLDKVRRANQLRYQLSTIQNRASEWNEHKKTRDALLAKTGYLPLPAAAMTALVEADQACAALCAQARERLENRDIESLSEDELWRRLLNQADKSNNARAAAISANWRALISDLGTVETAQALFAREPETPGNKTALARYLELYPCYAELRNAAMPPAATSASTLRDHVDKLREILNALTPMPESVKRFLKAIEAGGAALDLLNAEVLGWLGKYDDPSRFVIRTRTVASCR
ncbi:hypothetical protein [Paraburkholderia terrae]|uniref:hypothetical protein n=1 Tax=Paraburkholderia terrae TaxID=311230 RepID=UPI001EE19FE7|nr:hypothetical protein [Paraburkholderia terrae]GJG99176.1 hypothetical protein CBA19C8_01490 [Paraburkholderia terrae]